MVGALFAMDAWNNVGFAADELRRPSRDLPFAMLAGVGARDRAVRAGERRLPERAADRCRSRTRRRIASAPPRSQAMFGAPGLYVMAAAIIVSTIGCNNGLILAGARVYYAMARDGLFFRSAERLHPTYKTPAFGLWVQAVWASVLCVSERTGSCSTTSCSRRCCSICSTAIGLFVLRVTRAAAPRPVVVPLYPWLPAAYILLTGALCIDLLVLKPQYSWLGLGIVALGLPGLRAVAMGDPSRDSDPECK